MFFVCMYFSDENHWNTLPDIYLIPPQRSKGSSLVSIAPGVLSGIVRFLPTPPLKICLLRIHIRCSGLVAIFWGCLIEVG